MTAAYRPAVLNQRVEPPDSLDFFPTPPWATRVATNILADAGCNLGRQSALDPCCGMGDMVRPLREVFRSVRGEDIHDYGHELQARVSDYTQPDGLFAERRPTPDWVFINPPFNVAEAFVVRALAEARVGVAVFARTNFLESQERYRTIYRDDPPDVQVIFVHRPVLLKGRLRDPDQVYLHTDPSTGEVSEKKATTMTAYSWLLWGRGGALRSLPPRIWVAETADERRALERPGDYPPLPPEEDPGRGAFG